MWRYFSAEYNDDRNLIHSTLLDLINPVVNVPNLVADFLQILAVLRTNLLKYLTYPLAALILLVLKLSLMLGFLNLIDAKTRQMTRVKIVDL